jgi:hypothetical protein
MRYFVPDHRLADELSPQSKIEEKLGGMPWGLPSDRWPMCANCGKPLSLLAQLLHHSERLNLGHDGRSLFVFQCNQDPGMCSSWEGGSGANACFVLEPEQLIRGLSPVPEKAVEPDREVRIVNWIEREDGLTAEQAAFFFDEAKWDALEEDQREELFEKSEQCTRLGGVPTWIQSMGEAPQDGWRFVGQLDSDHRFLTPPAPGAKDVRAVKTNPDNPQELTYFCSGPNFGDAGIGYIFLKDAAGVPEGWFFWQCG